MRKKPSGVAILVAVIFSIFLFPFVLLGGIGSGTVFSMASAFQQEREEDLYRCFVERGGIDWAYDLAISGIKEGLGEDTAEFGVEATKLLPKNQLETIVYDIYHAFIKGEEYQFDFSYQENVVKEAGLKYFDETIENKIRTEYGALYDLLDENQKKFAITAAREIYIAEMDAVIEEEITSLEQELSTEFNNIYEMEELKELKALEEETGFSLTDRTKLCYYLNLGGYLLLGLTGVFLLVLLLCHLFRPSGFFTAGAFTLVLGGLLMGLAKVAGNVLLRLINTELSAELTPEEFPDFVMPMLGDVMGWFMQGFEKVGKISLMAAVILILVGILLLVIQKNKAEAEPVYVMGMQ